MDWLLHYADPSLDWNYAMTTLVVRFVGVFVVMLVMQVALQAAARGVRWVESREAAPAVAPRRTTPGPATAPVAGQQGLDDATVAAIGLALALEAAPSPPMSVRPASAWAMTGRIEQMQRLLR